MSWIIFALLVILLVLVPSGLRAPSTLLAVAIVGVGTAISAVLNRIGKVTMAGVLLVTLVMLAILGAVAGTPDGKLSLVYLPAYDLFAIAVLLAASILPPSSAFIVAGVAVALIVGDLALQPHAGDVTEAIKQYGAVSLVTRPIALQIIVAAVAYLWVRGTRLQIERADRAEEVADLERRELENKRQIEMAAQQLLEVHTRVANGDYNARATLDRGNVLWSVAQSLNNLLQRLQRQGQAEYQLRRTEEEAQRLATALDEANAGRYPLWPARASTVIDILLERIATRGPQTGRVGYSGQQQALPPQRPPRPLPQGGFTPSGPGGQNSFPPPSSSTQTHLSEQSQIPQQGGLPEGWPAFSPSPEQNRGDRPTQTSDNPWFLPPEGGNW